MKRTEIKTEYTWNLSHMFATESDWENTYLEVSKSYLDIAQFQGKLKDKATILQLLELLTKVNSQLELMYVYSHCKRDENQADEGANVRYSRISNLLTEVQQVASFVTPELSNLDEDLLNNFIADPQMSEYDYMFKRILQKKPYTLTFESERILALSGDIADGHYEVFEALDNVDMKFPSIVVDGLETPLTHGTYSKLLQNPSKDVRAEAYEKYYQTYESVKNMLNTNYCFEVKKDIFYTRARNYKSFLDRAFIGEDVPKAVYDKLLEKVHGGLKNVHEYVHLRKELLGIDTIHMYDLYCPVVAECELSVEFDEAKQLVLDALKPLGEEYCDVIKTAYNERWIDVYECEGKRSGGYCTHANIAPHPYVLLNYSQTTHDVFTLAHELGHAMHSYYSSRSQPPEKADYKIFVAEVASTVNEMLLLENLLSTTKDKNFKKFLLAYRLDTLRTTIFRQTMFSEFEAKAHEMEETGKPLTIESLSALYNDLNRQYYGQEIEKDEHIQYEYLRIPHFYYNFYVYKYATGLICSICLSQRILKGTDENRAAYKEFLCAGGSKSPYEILKDAGVDLLEDEPYDAVDELFKNTLQQIRELG